MEQLLYKPDAQTAAKLGLGRTTLWELISTGEIETVKIGRSRRIPADALVAYVDRLRENQPQGAA